MIPGVPYDIGGNAVIPNLINRVVRDTDGNGTYKVTVPPAVEPVTVAEAKAFARIDGSDEDALLGTFIEAARQRTEEYLRRALIEQTIEYNLDWWFSRDIPLPMPPLISITKVETVAEDGVATLYDAANYYTVRESIPGRLVIRLGSVEPVNVARAAGGYRITFQAGYGSTASAVPGKVRLGIQQWAVFAFENRRWDEEMPDTVRQCLRPFRRVNV